MGMRPAGGDRPDSPETKEEEKAPKAPAQKVRLGHMDHFAEQKRVSWDELKANLAKANLVEEGVPGSNQFDSYSAKLEKQRNERLQQQEAETKRMLKQINKGKVVKDKKEKKGKEKKGKDKEKKVKKTADGAVLAASSDDSSEAEDVLLKRYKGS